MPGSSAVVLTGVVQVERCNSEMIEKRGKVGARSQRGYRQITGRRRRLRKRVRISRRIPGKFLDSEFRAQARLRAGARLWITDAAGHLIDEVLQGMTAAGHQKAARVDIRIDIQRGVPPELFSVVLNPFRRADPARLFGVPTGIYQSSPRSPSRPNEATYGLGLFHQRHCSGER